MPVHQLTRKNKAQSVGSRQSSSHGPVHVYKCNYCGKTFRKKAYDTALNKHKGKNGYPCGGTYGSFVKTEWK